MASTTANTVAEGGHARRDGIVKKLTDKGFGFLCAPGQEKDLFFHQRALVDVQFDELHEGDSVQFSVLESARGLSADAITRDGSPVALQEVVRRALEQQRDNQRQQTLADELEEELTRAVLDAKTSSIIRGVRIFSTWAALEIARNPNTLRDVEWRALEHIIAEVFEGLGFTVSLTESSKDGGKDVILEWTVNGCRKAYVVEIKHWGAGKRVGNRVLRRFLSVIVHEERDGGLFLSTSGYSSNAFEQFSVIERHLVRLGDGQKVVGLCQTFHKFKLGLWSAPNNLAEIIYDQTL